MTTYIQYELLSGTCTYKVRSRDIPPLTKPQNAKRYRYFNLSEDVPSRLANEYVEKDMINLSEWRDF